jgi:hypothetical protein
MTPFILHRDARLIELDLLTLCEVEHEPADYRPLLRRFSDRVGQLADKLQQLEILHKDKTTQASRWELLYETQGITWSESELGVKIFREVPNGLKLLSTGRTLNEAADKALGIK